jgi:hypothetical protein
VKLVPTPTQYDSGAPDPPIGAAAEAWTEPPALSADLADLGTSGTTGNPPGLRVSPTRKGHFTSLARRQPGRRRPRVAALVLPVSGAQD